jgi:hypothetical protein
MLRLSRENDQTVKTLKIAAVLGLVALLFWLEAGGGEGDGQCFLLGNTLPTAVN